MKQAYDPRTTPDAGAAMKAKINLSLEARVTSEARALGVNMSRVAEEAIAQAVKLERNRRWAQENRDALDAYTREVEREGVPLARYRTF
jgi:antitoxin CcdA